MASKHTRPGEPVPLQRITQVLASTPKAIRILDSQGNRYVMTDPHWHPDHVGSVVRGTIDGRVDGCGVRVIHELQVLDSE